MPLFSRSSGSGAEAVYARVLDGRHLWLAVSGEGPLSLVGDGVPTPVPTEERDGLLTAVVDLSSIGSEARLVAGRKESPVLLGAASSGAAAVTRDPGGFEVLDVDGRLVVRRVPAAGIPVAGLAATEDGVSIAVGDAVAEVALVVKDRELVVLPVADGILALATVPALVGGATATFRTPAGPLVRSGNVLARPNYAVLLPPMLEPDVELRWLKDGRLALHRGGGAA